MGAVLIGLLEALGLWLSPKLDRFFGRFFDRPPRWAHQKLGHLPISLRMSIFFAVGMGLVVTFILLVLIGFFGLLSLIPFSEAA